MTKRKNKIKVKVSNNTINTLIKVAGLGIVSYLAFKMLPNNENGLVYLGGSSSGYTGSGTDFSGLGLSDFLPFMQETPPTFVVNNPPLPTGFFTPSDEGLNTPISKKDEVIKFFEEKKPITFTPAGLLKDDNFNDDGSNNFSILNPSSWVKSKKGQPLRIFGLTFEAGGTPLGTGFKINTPLNEPIRNFLIKNIPFLNIPAVAGGCSSGQCPKYDDNVSFTVDLSGNKTSNMFYTPSTPLINTNNNANINAQSFLTAMRQNIQSPTITYTKKAMTPMEYGDFLNKNLAQLERDNANINAQSFLTAMRQNIQSPTITYTKKAMTPMEYGDFFNKNLAPLEREAQNKMATSLASGNCSPAIATNQCSGTKKSVNYATAVAQTSERRYYENYGTPMTRSDLVYS